MTVDAFWKEYLDYAKLDKSTKYRNSYYFDTTEEGATKCLDLVLAGKQRATTGILADYDGNIPKAGEDYTIITDWHGVPHCVIQTTVVTIMPFGDMTFELCHREGAYNSLEAWRNDHMRYFKEEGYDFSEDMPILFREFEVVYTRR